MNLSNVSDETKKKLYIGGVIVLILFIYFVYSSFSCKSNLKDKTGDFDNKSREYDSLKNTLSNQVNSLSNQLSSKTSQFDVLSKKCVNRKIVYYVPGFISTSSAAPTLITGDCDDTRKVILLSGYPDGAFVNNRNTVIQPMCANMYSSSQQWLGSNTDTTKPAYSKEQTDWIFPFVETNEQKTEVYIKYVWVKLVLKNQNEIYGYVKAARFFVVTPTTSGIYPSSGTIEDMTNPYEVWQKCIDGTVQTPSSVSSENGYGIRNISFTIYNTIRPIITDLGYLNKPRGWFDTEGTGEATNYCIDIGVDSGATKGIWLSCVGPSFGNNYESVTDLSKKYKESTY